MNHPSLFVLISLLLPLTVAAEGFKFKNIEGKTIVPVEIRSPYLTCDRIPTVQAITQTGASPQFFIGKYRTFAKRNIGSGELENGLNFVTSEVTACKHPYANAFSIYEADVDSDKMSVMYLGLNKENIGRSGNRYQELIKKMESMPNNPIAQEGVALAKEHQRDCPWTKLQNVRNPVARASLECQLVERPAPAAQPDFVDRTVDGALKFLNLRSRGPKALSTVSIVEAENTEDYLWEVDFTLKNGKGRDETNENVKIESYLVCNDSASENVLVFAVMEKMMTGLKYMCR